MTLDYIEDNVKPKISIHMPHTWHDKAHGNKLHRVRISIHMPHTWHDPRDMRPARRSDHFNPHATYVA